MSPTGETAALPDDIQLALTLHRQGQLEDAETVYRRILSGDPDNHSVRHPFGVLLYQKGMFAEAEQELQNALKLAGSEAPGAYYSDLGNTLHKLGRLEDAEKCLSEAVRIEPTLASAQSNLGVVLTEAGRIPEALTALTKATVLAPGLAEPWINLAGASRISGDLAIAEQHLRTAIKIDPNLPIAHSNLGSVLMDQERLDEAEISCCQALALDPEFATGYANLAEVMLAQANPEDAREAYEAAIALDPNLSLAHSGLSNTLRHLGEFEGAIAAARKAVDLAPSKASTHFNLGLAYWETGDQNEALQAFETTLTIDPDVELAQYLVAALSGGACTISPQEFVTSIFDTNAHRFDFNLVNELGYRIPNELREIVREICEDTISGPLNVVDLGCGTGLCGPLFRDIADRLVGCDLAPNMVDKARERGLYDELYVEDLIATVSRSKGDADLVLATDVLVYVGDLQETFASVRDALKSGGFFGFSTEQEDGDGYSLRTSGRFSHSENYIRRIADEYGFQVLRADKTTIRKVSADDQRGIDGHLYMLKLDK